MFSSQKARRILSALGLILIGGAASFAGTRAYYQKKYIKPSELIKLRAGNSDYKLINPLLAIDVPERLSFPEYKNLQKKINDVINQSKSQNLADSVSVYFRDSRGKWVGVNQDETYSPASLFKVPIMISYLSQAENDPSILDQKITFNNMADQAADQEIAPSHSPQFGQTYTVEQLLEYMIEYSDNTAANILADRIFVNDPTSPFNKVLSELGIQFPTDPNQKLLISAKSYALFFRILYNSTFLSRAMSEKALELLSKSDFKDGLVAGVPAGTTVAHKFGEYGIEQNGMWVAHELHDCGIIYDPGNPYLLCVMTKGPTAKSLEQVIANISQVVWNSR